MVATRGSLGLLLLLTAGEVLAAGDVEAGRQVAEKVCARCHVVGTEKPYGGIESTPTFFIMNSKLDQYRQRVLTLKARPPHKALDLDEISNDNLENLVSYIDTLARP